MATTLYPPEGMSFDAREQLIQTRGMIIVVPEDLHPDTKRLVQGFAEALAAKLKIAENKYGYSNEWASPSWEAECRQHLREHLEKGDPRDVAIYAAFMWQHGWSTAGS
jgi:hypothetical protein